MQEHRDDDAREALTDDEAVRRERLLAAEPEEAWALLRDAEGLETWLADEVVLVVAPGEHGTLRDAGGEERAVVVEDVDPGRRLSLRWWTRGGEEAIVDLVLDDAPGGTRFVVTEIPLRVVAVPDAVPAGWSLPGDGGSTAWAPQALALACH